MTFNIRRAGSDDGENGWDNRRSMVLRWLKQKSADVVGFQELMPEVRSFLEEELEEYRFVGCARSEKLDDEACCIAYRKNRFECIGEDTFWLSDAPNIPGSKLKSSGYWMRICTTAELFDRDSGKRFRIYNTHLDNDSEQSRIDGLAVINRRMEQDQRTNPLPALLMGDFNATPESKVLKYARTHFPMEMLDVSELESLPENFTYHGFFKEETIKIDYIFASPEFHLNGSLLGNDHENGIYLSDHYPLLADLTLT